MEDKEGGGGYPHSHNNKKMNKLSVKSDFPVNYLVSGASLCNENWWE